MDHYSLLITYLQWKIIKYLIHYSILLSILNLAFNATPYNTNKIRDTHTVRYYLKLLSFSIDFEQNSSILAARSKRRPSNISRYRLTYYRGEIQAGWEVASICCKIFDSNGRSISREGGSRSCVVTRAHFWMHRNSIECKTSAKRLTERRNWKSGDEERRSKKRKKERRKLGSLWACLLLRGFLGIMRKVPKPRVETYPPRSF